MVEGDGLEIRCTVYGTEGSNPSLSDSLDYFMVLDWQSVRSFGEVSEWSMVHAWKACVLEGTGGSNPPFSVFSQPTDSVLCVFTQPRQDRKVAAVSELCMRRR